MSNDKDIIGAGNCHQLVEFLTERTTCSDEMSKRTTLRTDYQNYHGGTFPGRHVEGATTVGGGMSRDGDCCFGRTGTVSGGPCRLGWWRHAEVAPAASVGGGTHYRQSLR